MAYTLEQLATEIRQALKAQPGPEGRQKVCVIVQNVLKDSAFVTKLGSKTPQLADGELALFEDPELGFCILAHNYTGAKESNPHDHAHSWAIYGQAMGETEMTDWDLVEKATPDKPGKARRRRVYTLKSGMAYVYNEGDLHSPRREGSTKLIRIEGTNMDKVKRLSYERA